jgi:hypothetical protein
MVNKITFKRHIKLIYPCLLSILLSNSIILLVFISFLNKYILMLWVIEFLFIDFRTILIHFDYWLKNKSIELYINDNSITYKSPDEIIHEPINELLKIEIYRHVFENENWVSFKNYYHYKLYFKDNKTMIITSLLKEKLNLPCDKIKVKRRNLPFKY